jgi:hypothetical protein
MRRIALFVWTAFVVLVLNCVPLWAQATAQISGSVRDQSAAVLPGVEITSTQTETGITRTTITNETGSYVLSNLALGPYRLEAALPGFRTYAQTGIILQVNSSPTINIVLEVGQVTEQVEVQANAALVETRSSTLGSVIENQRILQLPLDGRNVIDLIELAGGAVNTNSGRDLGLVGARSPQFAIGGSIGFDVGYSLDGASHVSYVTGSNMVMPFPDAMQEFKVENSGVTSARDNSTAVSAVTRSGTNDFHGSAFEFIRNDLFNARNYFAQTGSTLKRNQFGGTLGGPIVQNQLFFFGGYQRTTLRQDPANLKAFIPTRSMLAGDWTTFASPACNNGRQITLPAPFVNNRIDPGLYSKPALYVVNWNGQLPFPKTDHPCGEITYGNLSANDEGIAVGKVDYQVSAAHSLFGRVLFQTSDDANPQKFNTNLLQSTGWRSSMQSSYAMGSTYLIDPNTVHTLRLAFNRTANNFFNVERGELFNWCDAGVRLYCGPEITRVNQLVIAGGFTVNGNHMTGFKYIGNSYSLTDELSLVRGSHQFAFGGSVMHGRESTFTIWGSPHHFTFNGSVTGSGLADFMIGRPSQLFTNISYPHHVQQTVIGLFATDTWKARPSLTLNYGIRWSPFLPQSTPYATNFDYDRFRQGIKSRVYLNAPAGMQYHGDPGFPKRTAHARWNLFAPRAGLAWDPTGDGRMAVRASYALSHIFVPGNYREWFAGSAPFGNQLFLINPPGGLEDPLAGLAGANIFPYQLGPNAPFVANGLFFTQSYDIRSPYSQSWNISVQRQIGSNALVSASYVGSNITHIWSTMGKNPAVYFPGVADANGNCTRDGLILTGGRPGTVCSSRANTEQRRRLTLENPLEGSKIGLLLEGNDEGTQNYNGMTFSAQYGANQSMSIQGNYTWSHCIGDYATLYYPMVHPNDTITDPRNRGADRGNCESDRRHFFNMTGLAQTPQFSNRMIRTLATDWQLAVIYRISSGSPLNITVGSDRALNGTADALQRVNQVTAHPFGDRSAAPLSSYLNPAAFAPPAEGTFGNVGRNSIRGPAFWSFDMALSRVFRLRESQTLEFRAEAYNVTNSFRPANPATVLGNTNTFGLIRSARDPRILQLALKYVF